MLKWSRLLKFSIIFRRWEPCILDPPAYRGAAREPSPLPPVSASSLPTEGERPPR